MVAIDLLPAEYRVARRVKRVAKVATFGVVGLGIFAASLTAVKVIAVTQATARLDDLKAQRQTVEGQVKGLGHIAALDASVTNRRGQLATAFAGELSWPQLMSSLKSSIPQGAKLTSIASAGSSGGTAFSVSGSAQQLDGVAAWLSSVEGVSGVVTVHPNNAVRDGVSPTVNFSATAQFVGPLSGKCSGTEGSCP